MDKILRKMGMSQTRHELKFASPSKFNNTQRKPFKNSESKTYKNEYTQKLNRKVSTQVKMDNRKRNKIQQKAFKKKQSSNLISSSQKQILYKNSEQNFIVSFQSQQSNKIRELIDFLNQRKNHKCAVPQHEFNKINYVCLQPNCPDRLGCAYCFLHSHQLHLKTQVDTCINDLMELKFKIEANEKLIYQKANNFYADFLGELNQEINNIRAQFQTNICFLKKKIQDSFCRHFQNNYKTYLSQQESIQQFTLQTDRSDLKHFDFNDTIKLKEINKIVQRQSFRDNKEKQLLNTLAFLNFEEVYSFLRRRLEIFHFQSAESKIYMQFFEELNSSVTHLFSAFKRNLPMMFAQPRNIEKPKILSQFS